MQFCFALKNSKKFDHYSITQQAIKPFSNGSKKLSLVREAESGKYLPLNSELIKEQNIYKILLLNSTETSAENYHLFCRGQKVTTIPGTGWNALPVFANLMSYDLELENLLDGVNRCRFFSENQKKLTGMTNIFELDFNNLIKKTKPIDLKKIQEPEVFTYQNEEIVKNRDGDKILPLNGYFYFSKIKEISHSAQDYSSIDIVVNNKLFQ